MSSAITYIDQLTVGNNNVQIEGLINSIEEKNFASKPGKYIDIELSDKTGKVVLRKWDRIEELPVLKKGDVVKVNGKVNEFKGVIQIIVNSVEKLQNQSADKYLPAYSEKEIEESYNNIKKITSSINNKWLKKLTDKYFSDEEFIEKFLKAPAAKGYHHNKIGGLVIHTSSVMTLCNNLIKNYPEDKVNRDLLVAGAFIHDTGKITEYEYSSAIDMTVEGVLLGHIVIGTLFLEKKIAGIKDFPNELSVLLKHMIISHHGEYEWGSPKKPKILEAMILHYADNIDAKVEGINMLTDEAKKNGNIWSSKYDGRNFLASVYCADNIPEQELF